MPPADPETLSEKLVSWAWSLRLADVPPEVRHTLRRHLLDGIGTAVAGLRTGATNFAPVVAHRLAGPGQATLFGSDERIGSPAAALALGTLIHALDFDDTHADALVHPTSVVAAVALSVGEEVDADAERLLLAMAAGYEVMLRLGAAVKHGFHARGFHATAVCGVFAAALIAARLRGLDQREAVDALGIAGSQAAGSLEFLATGAATKQLHPGWASLAGIVASDLAAAGATGPTTILEGDAGLFRSYTGRVPDTAGIVADLSERWELTRITVKPYPACQLSHASLDAVATLAEQPDPASVTRIDVGLPADSVPIVGAPAAEKAHPRTPYDAKFSLPWCLAALLVDGKIDLSTFDADNLTRPELQELAERVTITAVDTEVAAAAAPGHVRLTLSDDRVVEAGVACSRGGPERPLTDEELRAKFDANIGGRSDAGETLAHTIFTLGEGSDSAALHRAIAAVATNIDQE